MADDFRQNVQRERAVTDSILRPPAREPFDLLDEAIGSIPEMVEGRRAEAADADLRRELQQMQQDFTANIRAAELTAEEIANQRTYWQGRIESMEQNLAGINRDEYPDEWQDANAVLQTMLDIYNAYPVGLTGEQAQAGGRAADFQRVQEQASGMGLDIATAMTETGMLARQTGEALEDARTERSYDFAAGEAALDREQALTMVDLQQAFDRGENIQNRLHDIAMQDARFEDQASRDAFMADLERELQAGTFTHQWEMQQDANAFAAEQASQERAFNRDLALELIDAEASVEETLQRQRLDSAESIEAARNALGWYQAKTGHNVARGHLAVAQAAQDLQEDQLYLDSMIESIKSFNGDPDNPMVEDLLQLVADEYTEDSPQYRAARGAAYAIGSEAAELGLERTRYETEAARLANEQVETLTRMYDLQADGQEIQNGINEWNQNRNVLKAFREDADSVYGVVAQARADGDDGTIRMIMAMQSNPAMARAAFGDQAQLVLSGLPEGYLSDALAEAEAAAEEAGPTARERARTTFDQKVEEGNLNIQSSAAEYQRAVEVHADQVAVTIADEDALNEYILMMGRPSSAEELERLGGTFYLNAVRSAYSRQKLRENMSDRDLASQFFLDNVEDSDEWADGARPALRNLYPTLTESEIDVLVDRMRNERGYANEMLLLDLQKQLAEDGLGGMDPGDMNSAINNWTSNQRQIIDAKYSDCAGTLSTFEAGMAQTFNFGEPLTCDADTRSAYRAELAELANTSAHMYTQLLGGAAMLPSMVAWLTSDENVEGSNVSPSELAQHLVNGQFPPEANAAALEFFMDMYWDDAWDSLSDGAVLMSPAGEEVPVGDFLDILFAEEFELWKHQQVFGGTYLFPNLITVDRNGNVSPGTGEREDTRSNRADSAALSSQIAQDERTAWVPTLAQNLASVTGGVDAITGNVGTQASGAIDPAQAAENVPVYGDAWKSGMGNQVNNAIASWGGSITLTPGQAYSGDTARVAGVTEGAPHHGLDVVYPDGVIPNNFSGAVTVVDHGDPDRGDGSMGYWLLIRNNATGDLFTLAHLEGDHSNLVGHTIPQGSTIGLQGNTGSSTNDHVDYQWWGRDPDGLIRNRDQATQMSVRHQNTSVKEQTDVFASNFVEIATDAPVQDPVVNVPLMGPGN